LMRPRYPQAAEKSDRKTRCPEVPSLSGLCREEWIDARAYRAGRGAAAATGGTDSSREGWGECCDSGGVATDVSGGDGFPHRGREERARAVGGDLCKARTRDRG